MPGEKHIPWARALKPLRLRGEGLPSTRGTYISVAMHTATVPQVPNSEQSLFQCRYLRPLCGEQFLHASGHLSPTSCPFLLAVWHILHTGSRHLSHYLPLGPCVLSDHCLPPPMDQVGSAKAEVRQAVLVTVKSQASALWWRDRDSCCIAHMLVGAQCCP